MGRIQVVPERLEALGAEFGRASGDLERMQWALTRAVTVLEWEGLTRGFAEAEVQEARSRWGALARQAEVMARFLQAKAEAFRTADSAEVTPEHSRHVAVLAVIGKWVEQERRKLWARPEQLIPFLTLGSVFGVLPLIPILRNPGWIFGPSQAPPPDVPAPAPAPPVQPPAPPADPFWDALAKAPVVEDVDGLHFTPEFQDWVNNFNQQIRNNWTHKSTDYAGTNGADDLISTYTLTPQKVQQLWETARQNHVDPRLLLAILKQEGTGSFDTNPVNSSHFSGHGPQPDFTADLKAALDGPICSKLRLYGAAVQGGFPGSFIDWVNWYTPIDSAKFKGAPGVYATDINWGAGVARFYRDIAKSVGGGGGDPVADYSRWMGEHSGLFKPKYIDGDFLIKPGLPPGVGRPDLALDGGYPKPYPDAKLDSDDGFWKFPAPDQYLWHIERK